MTFKGTLHNHLPMAVVASERVDAQILAVDLDDLTLGRLRAAVRGTELSVCPVSREEAVERAAAADGPIIVLLEWTEEGEEEHERLCQALRHACRSGRCHIVALGGLADQATLFRAMEGAADDVLSRPFGGDLVIRLRRAVRPARGSNVPATPRLALEEALTSPRGGEVAVRSGDVTAFIHVQDGHVVWAHVSSAPASMEEVLRYGGVSLDRDVIDAVKEECRATGGHFMEVLVRWGIVDQALAREAVRAFVADRVKLALELPDAVALFLPRSRPHTGRLRFRASEIPSLRVPTNDAPPSSRFDAGPPSVPRAPLSLAEISSIVHAAVQVEGAVGAAVLDRKSGASLFHAGAEMDTTVVWSQLATLSALGPSAEDVMAAAGDRCFVTRPLRPAASLALFVVLSLSATTLGLARATIARIASPRAAAATVVVFRDGSSGD